MSPKANKSGHLVIKVARRFWFVHRLVLLAFVGPPPKGAVARHFPDRDPANNRPENLLWGTPADNSKDMLAHGTQARGDRCHLHKLTPEDVRFIRSQRGAKTDKSKLTQKALAERFGMSVTGIQRVQYGEVWGWLADRVSFVVMAPTPGGAA
jgi:hypothetical protein